MNKYIIFAELNSIWIEIISNRFNLYKNNFLTDSILYIILINNTVYLYIYIS